MQRHLGADCEPPVLSERALQEMAPDIRERSVRNVCKHRDTPTEKAVWDSTQEECSKGWLSFCNRASLSSSSVVSTRFGVQQNNKVRPIDNFRSSFVNSACGVREKVAMDGIDEIVSACLHWLRHKRPRHHDDRIVGRTWDLKSAYKQLAVRADHKKYAVVCVVDPLSNDVRFAKLHSMPFGALAAVHAFLRCGEALKFLGRRKLLLVMTNFFDDFTVLASYANSSHVQAVVSFMFRKLGWQVADEDKKNKPFAEVFDVLGVRVDLSQQHEGTVSVSNTPERIDELRDFVRQVLARGFITYEESQRLRGRFLFAEQHVWGRNSRQAVVPVGDVPPEASGWVRLTDTQVSALHFLEQRVLDGKPRIFATAPRGELRLWIDGACEWDVPSNSPICGFGGVLLIGDKPVAWGCTLPADKARKWAARVGKQQLVGSCFQKMCFLRCPEGMLSKTMIFCCAAARKSFLYVAFYGSSSVASLEGNFWGLRPYLCLADSRPLYPRLRPFAARWLCLQVMCQGLLAILQGVPFCLFRIHMCFDFCRAGCRLWKHPWS